MGGPKGHVQTESELGGRPVSEPERRGHVARRGVNPAAWFGH